MKYIEFCAGIGGTRTGFEKAGWKCELAIDHDPDAVAVHRLVHASGIEGDVTAIKPEDLPDADVWVAGFPCQPFSSSGTRLGFAHSSGNVFEHLVRLMDVRRPQIALFENVVGLLSNKDGHTFATILSLLTRLEYKVDWLVIDLNWLGVPQTRPRLFIVATQHKQPDRIRFSDQSDTLIGLEGAIQSFFAPFLAAHKIAYNMHAVGSLSAAVEALQPAVGKPKKPYSRSFGKLGHVDGDVFTSYDVKAGDLAPTTGSLAAVVAPDFPCPQKIRSVRYWSPQGGGGASGFHVRQDPLSHCVGTSLGGAPLYSVPLNSIRSSRDRAAFLRFANWHRQQDGMLVMRLRPDRTALLFGAHTEALASGLREWTAGDTRKYKLVGNMVGPIAALTIANLLCQDRSETDNFRLLKPQSLDARGR